jgi:spermidine/putrescine transport system ATP-binding protein
VRPEALALAQDASALTALPNRFQGRVSAVLFDGANSSLLIEAPDLGEPARAVLPQAGPLAGIAVGAPVHFGFSAEAARVFAA